MGDDARVVNIDSDWMLSLQGDLERYYLLLCIFLCVSFSKLVQTSLRFVGTFVIIERCIAK